VASHERCKWGDVKILSLGVSLGHDPDSVGLVGGRGLGVS
jgi:hypothetical protein